MAVPKRKDRKIHMNTIKALIEHFSKKDTHGHYLEITIHTRGGNKFTGSLAKWDSTKSPNLVEITHDSGGSSYINMAEIEAVSC